MATNKEFMLVPFKKINPDTRNQTREWAKNAKEFQRNLERLAESLLDRDVINPIIVTAAEGGTYDLHDGFRRTMAITWIEQELLKSTKDPERLKLIKKRLDQWNKNGVPVRLKNGDVREIALESNLHRENYSHFNLAEILMQKLVAGATQKDVAKELHLSEAYVSTLLTTYKRAGKALKEAWRDGSIPYERAALIARNSEGEEQDQAVAEQIALGKEGTKEAKMKATAAAKKDKGDGKRKQHRLRISDMNRYIKRFDKISGDGNPYLQGFVDAFYLATGKMSDKELREERKAFAKALEQAPPKAKKSRTTEKKAA